MGDELFSQDTVRDFMASKGGKVKNHELVTHFRRFLNDPQRKGVNRGKFREYVNTLAMVKLDETGEKVLVLKRKFRNSFIDHSTSSKNRNQDSDIQYERPKKRPPKAFPAQMEEESSTDPEPLGATASVSEPEVSEMVESTSAEVTEDSQRAETPSIEIVTSREDPEESHEDDGENQMSEESVLHLGTDISESNTDDVNESNTDDANESNADDVNESTTEVMNTSEEVVSPMPVPEEVPPQAAAPEVRVEHVEETPDETDAIQLPTPEWDQQTRKPAEVKLPAPEWDKAPPPNTPATTGPTPSKEPPMSVKERAKHLNRMQSETDVLQTKSKRHDKNRTGGSEDDTNSVSSVGTIALDAAGREWMITCSTGDYQAINKLLTKNNELAKRKDFITNALHWAAKHGNSDVIKLLCGTGQVDINARSGYTALHLAAMHGHDEIIELLVKGYYADPTIRDYSGKKPLQYMQGSVSAKIKQILTPRRVPASHMNQPFKRQGSYSAKIQKSSYFGITSSAAVRDSWASNASDNESRSRSPSPSPRIQRKASIPLSLSDMKMMPPPQQVPLRRRKKKSIKRESNEASSDSELPTRSDSLPNISNSMPDVTVSRPTSQFI